MSAGASGGCSPGKREDGELRCDNIGFGGLRLLQRSNEFCYGIDAVLLADFVARGGGRAVPPDTAGKRVMDLGCGTGIIPLILSHKTDFQEIWGLELQMENVGLALQNAAMNRCSERIRPICRDVSEVGAEPGGEWAGSFDAVCTNPPYIAEGCGIPGRGAAKYLSRHETSGTLEDFVRAASYLLKHRGDFYMIHRPFRLVDILCLCRKWALEPKVLRMVAPRAGEAPNLLLLHCVRNGNPELRVMEPLWVYQGESYTEEIEKIYERAAKK